jgi:hypothetical protein
LTDAGNQQFVIRRRSGLANESGTLGGIIHPEIDELTALAPVRSFFKLLKNDTSLAHQAPLRLISEGRRGQASQYFSAAAQE